MAPIHLFIQMINLTTDADMRDTRVRVCVFLLQSLSQFFIPINVYALMTSATAPAPSIIFYNFIHQIEFPLIVIEERAQKTKWMH